MDLRMSAKAYFGIPSPLKKFLRDFKVRPLIPQGLNLPHFTFKMGIKLQQCTLRCVLKRRNRLGRRTVTPFVFADSFGPKDVLDNLQCHLKLRKNFLKRFEDPRLIPQNGIFA